MKRKILSNSSSVKTKKIIALIVAIIIVVCSAAIVSCKIVSDHKASLYSPPPFEVNVTNGTPSPNEKFSYGKFKTKNDFSVGLCAIPKYEKSRVEGYFTNPSENKVWLMFEILDADGKTELGKSGIIKPGEYVKSIYAPSLKTNETYTFRVLAFTPNVYTSEGQIDLTGLHVQ